MEIIVTTGKGSGPTELAAFDRALMTAGIANLNLIVLSSVIPKGAGITVGRPCVGDKEWGYKAYVVLAERRESTSGKEAWAGIGWVVDEESGAGLFVEHDGATDEDVRSSIRRSLDAMTSYRTRRFGPIQMVTEGSRCASEPVCAVAAALYRVENWRIGPLTGHAE